MKFNTFARFFRNFGLSRKARKAQRSRLPRPIAPSVWLEPLEDRMLLAVLPYPVVTNQNDSTFGSGISPQVIIDPINPNKMVEVQSSGSALEAFSSTDAGKTWTQFYNNFAIGDPNTPAGGGAFFSYAQVTSPSASFDRTESVYVVASEHNAAFTSGAIVLEKFNFSFDTPAQTITDNVLYQWYNQDAAYNPVVAVDNNVTSFTDPTTHLVQTDTLATLVDHNGITVPKAVYVAWNTQYTEPNGHAPAALSQVMVEASDDGGQTFSTQQYVTSGGADDPGSAPQIVFTQGRADNPATGETALAGGQLGFIFNGATYAPGTSTYFFDKIETNFSQPDGGVASTPVVAAQVFDGNSGSILGAVSSNNTTFPQTTTFDNTVAITDPSFTSLADLQVTLNLTEGGQTAVQDLEIDLVSPTGQSVTLVASTINAAGKATGLGLPSSGATLGTLNGQDVGTVFDDDAQRNIVDATATYPYIGHFTPEFGGLSQFDGMTPAELAGDWKLEITDFNVPGSTDTQALSSWSLNFTSGISTTGFGGDNQIPTPATTLVPNITILPAGRMVDGSFNNNYALTTPGSGSVGIGPGIVAAVDNTLGSFSEFQGRIYIAYTGYASPASVPFTAPATYNTDILLISSDDGGRTWSDPVEVNGVSDSNNISENGRTQYMPSVAVDETTGTVVVTYYDARYDAANARFSNSISSSIDGGQTFSQSVYLNTPATAYDAITYSSGSPVIDIEPVPGNQGAAGTLGFGDRAGLAVYGGEVFPVFSSNLNAAGTEVMTATVTIAAGPRGIVGDQGPITQAATYVNPITQEVEATYNNQFAADGTREFTAFVVTLDRPVDPSTFTTSEVNVLYHNTTSPTGSPGVVVAVGSVTPLDLGAFGATTFLITLATPQSAVGTYTYTVGPLISDRIRTIRNGTTQPGNEMDENQDAITGEDGTNNNYDLFEVPGPLNGTTPDQLPYDPNTLPIIIPGPHVVSTTAVGQVAGSTDSEVLDKSASQVTVTFDRNINPATFTAADVLSFNGPTGSISGPFTVTPETGNQTTFIIGFPTQVLSGTYTLTLAPTIQDTLGNEIDTNLNAGLDLLRGTNSTNTVDTVTTYNTANPLGLALPANTTTVSDLTVADAYEILQDATNHIQLSLNITIPDTTKLVAKLVAPDGATITLFTNVGNSKLSETGNFSNTIFDDSSLLPIQLGVPPYDEGPYDPQTPLSALIGHDSKGVWQLVIANSGTVAGTLNYWTLKLPHAVPGSGLGEPSADQINVTFRIFNEDPTNLITQESWTPIGPASINNGANAGSVGAIAVDPADPSGNTVYVGGSDGGVWKTTDFLTTNPNGPTYIPLTDLGPTTSLNIGSIALFDRNNDPSQTEIFVATGDPDVAATGNEQLTGSLGTVGVGILFSPDGGKTWTVLDSTHNYDSNGNPLPMDSSSRDHIFDGNSSYKVIVDPTPLPSGGVVVFAAFSGTNGGLWRSVDGGRDWTDVKAGQATDVVLAAGSANNAGNLQDLYAGFAGQGVYFTSSADTATALGLLAGGEGNNLRRDESSGDVLIPVSAPSGTPNGVAGGRISLATPVLTNNRVEDTAYQGWIYAEVSGSGLYVSKDFGNNWTQIQNGPVSAPFEQTLSVDPDNPNVVYVGTNSGLYRVDITKLNDANTIVPYTNSANDGGKLQLASTGGASVLSPGGPYGTFDSFTGLGPYPNFPTSLYPPLFSGFYNLQRDPNNPFVNPSTIQVDNITNINNTGLGAVVVGMSSFLGISSEPHTAFVYRDPVTGLTRLIIGDDQGVFTAVDHGDGSIEPAIGTSAIASNGVADVTETVVTGTRNGNLQITQFYDSASQPSSLASDIQSALVYGSTYANGEPISINTNGANLIETGDLNYTGVDLQGDILLGTETAVATDPTGGLNAAEQGVGGSVYEFRWPNANLEGPFVPTDFFLVTQPGQTITSRTNGLLQAGDDPGSDQGQWPSFIGSRFAVNPIDPTGIVVSSQDGRIFRTYGPTTGIGVTWFDIGNPTDLDGSYAGALAFGAPNPATPGDLDDFIYAGTTDGHIYVTFTGGGYNGSTQWRNISAGLDGSTVEEIVTDPTRGSHDAYAVTEKGVYYMADSSAANPTWVNITGNLFSLTRPLFNNSSNPYPSLTALTSIAADWRFAIPGSSGTKFPVLYVAGDGGVYRSQNDGKTWVVYPDITADGAVQEGGYLPNTEVTQLQLVTGDINPATGFPDQSSGYNMLIATTFGRGDFAIRLDNSAVKQYEIVGNAGPVVSSITPDTPNPGTSIQGIIVTFQGAVDPATVSLADVTKLTGPNGALTPTSFIDITPTPPAGETDLHNVYDITFAPQTTVGNYSVTFGPNITDDSGDPMVAAFSGSLFFTPDTPPVVSPIGNQITPENTATSPLAFTISSALHAASTLTVSAVSSNLSVVAASGIVFGGSGANRTITLTPVTGAVGTTTITLTVTDPQTASTSETFTLTVDTAPVITPLQPIYTLPHNQFPLTNIQLTGTSAANLPITFSGVAVGDNPNYDLRVTYSLVALPGGYYQNYRGYNEKYLMSTTMNQANAGQYVILPNGQVRENIGTANVLSWPLIATLSPAVWSDPTLITNAQPPVDYTTLYNLEQTYGFTTLPGGYYENYRGFGEKYIMSPTSNPGNAGQYAILPDGTLRENVGTANVLSWPVIATLDPSVYANPMLLTTATLTPAAYTLAYNTEASLDLTTIAGGYFQNYRGYGEKYLTSPTSNAAEAGQYALLPNGQLRENNGTANVDNWPLIATLDPSIWANPTLLTNARSVPNPTSITVSVNPATNILTVSNPNNFVGTFKVIVSANDGFLTSTTSFLVDSTDTAPSVTGLTNVSTASTNFPQTETPTVSDAEGDAVTLTASAVSIDPLYTTEQQLGLVMLPGGYYQNYRGYNEKYLMSPTSNQANAGQYALLPDGTLRQNIGTANVDSWPVVATFTPTVWADPTLLTNAAPPVDYTTLSSLEATYGFTTLPGGYYQNYRGYGEKYLVSPTFNQANAGQYALLPDGTLRQNIGTANVESWPIIASLDPSVFTNPTLLTQAVLTPAVYSLVYSTEASLDLTTLPGGYYESYRGYDEKYLTSPIGNPSHLGQYALLPNGQLRENDGTNTVTSWPLIATFSPAVWANPTLLTTAKGLPESSILVSVSGDAITATPPADYIGTFQVNVNATDGILNTQTSYQVTSTDAAPTISGLSDLTGANSVPAASFPKTVTPTITNAAGTTLTVTATAASVDPLLETEEQLNLTELPGGYYQNYRGYNEKYLMSPTSNQANAGQYALLPDGTLRQNIGTANVLSWPVVATFTPAVWGNPTLLTNPTAPVDYATLSSLEATYGFTTLPGGYYLNYRGYGEKYLMSPTSNQANAGQYAILPDGTLRENNGTANVENWPLIATLDGSVYANPTLLTTATLTPAAYALAYGTESQLGLTTLPGGYYQNIRGYNEKYLTSPTGNPNHLGLYALLPNGQLRSYDGTNTVANWPLVATLDPSIYTNPSLLTGATALPEAAIAVSVNPTTHALTLTPPADYIGTFKVSVTATDGILTTQTSFLVTSTDTAPTISALSNQTAPSGSFPLTVTPTVTSTGPGPVTVTATISGYSALYDAELALGLQEPAGGYNQNFRGANEKYLVSPASNQANGGFYALLPNGELVEDNGTSNPNLWPVVATFTPSVWADPTQLTNAQSPTAPAGATVTVEGNGSLLISILTGYTGTFRVNVTANDGILSTTQSFLVTAT